jgi:demethylmenaquinone methyltransferase / 2-methoxy-6-polyprenyl-1,4-benzoquinol methylase
VSSPASPQGALVAPLDVVGELAGGDDPALHRLRERGAPSLAQGVLQPGRSEPDRVEVPDTRNARRLTKDFLELRSGDLGLLDSLRIFGEPELDETRAQLAEVAAAGALLCGLAHRRDRDGVPDKHAVGHRIPAAVEGQPAALLTLGVRAQVDTGADTGLGRNDGNELLSVRHMGARRVAGGAQLLIERHRRNNSPMAHALTARNRAARELFAPLAASYDRYARLFSFGQDPRWRSALVTRVAVGPKDTVLDVATGTAAVALELARRRRCRVVGVDQSPEMLAAGRSRVLDAGLDHLIELKEARAEELPFADEQFDALTFTYLLRYLDDPLAGLRELVRVVKPGGTVAMVEFFVPRNPLTRIAWEGYVRVGLPLLGGLVSTGWKEVGRFLGPSIREFWARTPLERLLDLWREAGIANVDARPLSLGGGVVVWGARGD